MVHSFVTGIKYYVEVIGNDHSEVWETQILQLKRCQQSMEQNTKGVLPNESLITEENEFVNIGFVEGFSFFRD